MSMAQLALLSTQERLWHQLIPSAKKAQIAHESSWLLISAHDCSSVLFNKEEKY